MILVQKVNELRSPAGGVLSNLATQIFLKYLHTYICKSLINKATQDLFMNMCYKYIYEYAVHTPFTFSNNNNQRVFPWHAASLLLYNATCTSQT